MRARVRSVFAVHDAHRARRDGHYGLWLDDTLTDGSSARSPTFANEPLCSPGTRQGETVKFECVGLEVWGVG